MATKIRQLISQGVSPAEIAVIYRDNRDATLVAEMLGKQGVPFRVESQKNVLEDSQIKNLVTLLRFLNDLTDSSFAKASAGREEKLFEVLHADFLGLPALDIYKLISQTKRFDLESLKRSNLESLFSSLLRWQKLTKNVTLLEFFETITRESGFLEHLLKQPDSAVRLNRLDVLFSEIKNLVKNQKDFSLKNLINYFDTLEKHGVSIKEKNVSGQTDTVRLMTAHGAKGLEFDHVFITNLFDGHWGNRRIPQLIKLPPLIHMQGLALQKLSTARLSLAVDNFEKNDDERRLFYVAVTRARKMAYLSYPIIGRDKRDLLPSQFLGEIKTELKETGLAEEYEKKLEADPAILYQPRVVQKFSVLDKEYLNTLFFKRGLSATAVNNYISCPWKYFYSSLLKIPKAKNKHQIYGTAVHAGLKDFFDHLKREKMVSRSLLLVRFEEALKKEPLTEKDFEESLEKGKESLGAYFDYYQNSWRTQTINEFRVQNVMFGLPKGEVKLTGSLDKIELVDNFEAANLPLDPVEEGDPSPFVSKVMGKPTGQVSKGLGEGAWLAAEKFQVNVVDYKTGKPKTRNELEGKTQSATGDYKRQLVFYKLLLDEHPTAKLKMVSGVIDFVEPDQKGNFHKEKFLISDEDVQNLREAVIDISDQILNLKFQNKTCGNHDCEYCALRAKVL